MKKVIVISIVFFITISAIIFTHQYLQTEKEPANGETKKEIILTGPLGDFTLPDIESECNEQLEIYLRGAEFKDNGFLECIIVESKRSLSPEECQFAPPLGGCYVCVLKCK